LELDTSLEVEVPYVCKKACRWRNVMKTEGTVPRQGITSRGSGQSE
jgi:hypothetical protein